MAVYKNVSSQKIAVFAYDTANDTPKTGDAANITAQISKDGAATAATNDTNPTELDATDAPGIYIFDMTQAETNADLIVLYAKSSSTDIVLEPVIIYTTPGDNAALNANVTEIGSDTQSATDLKDFADAGYDPATNKVQGVVLVDTCTTNSDMRGTDSALLATSAPANFGDLSITATTGRVDVAAIEGTTATSQLASSAATGAAAALNAYDPPTNTEMVAAFTEIKGGTWSSSTDTLEAIRDRGDSAWITATGFSTLDAAGVRTAVGLATANLDTQLGEIVTDTGSTIPGFLATIIGDTSELQTDWANGGRLDLLIDGIKAVTDVIPDSGAMTSIAQQATVDALNDISATDVWAAATRTLTAGTNLSFSTFDPTTDEIESGVTYLQGLRAVCAALAGILTGADGSTITIKAIGAGSGGTTRITATVDANGNRSAITLNL